MNRLAALCCCAALLAAAPPVQRPAPARTVTKAKPKAPTRKPPAEGAALEGAASLAPYFAALRRVPGPEPGVEARAVRIAWFGDSHTAAGFWPGRLRARLQERLGDGGPGLVLPARPWRGYPRPDLEQDFGRRWPAESLRSSEASGRVGLAGTALEIPAEERLVLRGAFAGFRLQVLGPEALEPRVASAEEPTEPLPLQEATRTPLADGTALRILEPSGPGPFRSVSIGLPEGLRLLGVDLHSGRPGAVVDELGVNGAELLDLERWDPALRAALLQDLHPALLVLAFGTNDLGRRDLDGAAYRERAARLLRALREESGAPVLLVGPLDRMGRRRRGQNLKLGAKTVIAAMRGACADAGCAFWDARAAMGGEGSIQRWRRQRLAQRDLVHLNVGGYQKLADLLAKALDAAEAGWAPPPAATQ